MEPLTKPKITAKDFFLHIGVIVALYVFAISFLSFMFDIINYAFPDRQAFYGDPYSSSMRFALSTLMVSFPILILLLKVLYKDLFNNKEKREMTIRKWLIYLTLFVTSLTIAIDVIYLINTFLGGEITSRFILKALTIFVVAGGILWTTLSDLRGVFFEKPRARTLAISIASIIVLVSVIGGFLVIGSPSSIRDLRDDNQRLMDLQNIQYQILNNYQTKGSLPQSLAELSDPISGYIVPVDPKTELEYEYRTLTSTSTLNFELCSTFAKNSTDLKGRGEGIAYTSEMYIDPAFGSDNWKHEAGRACFTRSIDPLKYPKYPDVRKGL